MLATAVTAKIEIPRLILFVKPEFVERAEKIIEPFLSLASSDDLADARNEKIRGGNSLAVVVEPHIKRLDVLRIIRHEHGLFIYGLRKIPFMLRLEIASP